ncbi:hypothetical protein MKW92_032879, partial [Papaver armeniacum]
MEEANSDWDFHNSRSFVYGVCRMTVLICSARWSWCPASWSSFQVGSIIESFLNVHCNQDIY